MYHKVMNLVILCWGCGCKTIMAEGGDQTEIWESTLQGVTSCGSYGARDVLIIVSSESVEGPDIVPRKKGELAEKYEDRLANQGIPQECWQDDATLMEARYRKEHERLKNIYIENDPAHKREHILNRISILFNNPTQPGCMFSTKSYLKSLSVCKPCLFLSEAIFPLKNKHSSISPFL